MKRLSLRARMSLFFAAAVAVSLVLFSAAVIGVLVLGDNDDASEDVGQVLFAMVAVAPFAVGGAAAAGLLLARKSLEPLREAGRRARAAQDSVLELSLPLSGRGDEWDQLAEPVNALLATTRATFERIRRFTADAAHELRTPLTTILGESDLALRRERSPEELKRALEVVRAEALRLRDLAEKLLLLARADEGRLAIAPAPVRLDALVSEAIARARSHAEQLGRAVAIDASLAPVEVKADAALLSRVLDNLLDNAVRHGGPRVGVALRAAEARAELEVNDDGPGVPAALRPFLFERFACGDASRSQGGNGLGLALARSIAKAHAGELRYLEGQGARFLLELPRAA